MRFSVIDHGPGIAPQYQTQIFDRFFRVPGSEHTGAGLGLAIAKEIVLAARRFRSRLPKATAGAQGSEFYFDLPTVGNGEST